MSVPAFLEFSYNSACPGCGLAGWEHEDGCEYDAPRDEPTITAAEMVAAVDANAERIRGYAGEYGVPAGDDTIGYHCCVCGGTFDATPEDIAHARDLAGQDGLVLSDVAAFRQYGRDLCDAHQSFFYDRQIAAKRSA